MALYAGIPRAIDKITTSIKHFKILGIQAEAVYPEAIIQLPSVNQVPIYDIRNYNGMGQVTNNNSGWWPIPEWRSSPLLPTGC